MTVTIGSDLRGETAQIFNSAVAAWAISAAWELGALDELHEHGALDLDEFVERKRLYRAGVVGMFRALAAVDVVSRDENKVVSARNFSEVFRARSFFHWLARGSAELFRQMPELLCTQNRQGAFYRRDPAAIAFACREINKLCYDPSFWHVIDSLGFPFTLVADLGCGSGERIREILRRYPGTRGLGIDIAASCVEEATAAAVDAGLDCRARFLQADVLTMPARPEYVDVELLTCFMMGHDLWPRERCIDTLRLLRNRFPNVQRFIVGDATRTVGVADRDLPVFTLGFELGHDLMGVVIPTAAEWESVFGAGGWRLVHMYRIDIAVCEVIYVLEPH